MPAAAAEDQPGLDRVGDDDDRAALVEQLVGNGLLRDLLDLAEHAHGVAGALVLLRPGQGSGGQQARGQQQGDVRQAAHGGLHRSMHGKIRQGVEIGSGAMNGRGMDEGE